MKPQVVDHRALVIDVGHHYLHCVAAPGKAILRKSLGREGDPFMSVNLGCRAQEDDTPVVP